MAVPFIMALGVGVASIRSDENAAQDSFGLVALCSVGPILAVMVLALIYPGAGIYTPVEIPSVTDSRALWHLFQVELPAYLSEVAVCLAPIALFFAVFQAVSLKLKKKKVLKIVIGILYTYVGLVLFLTGANVGFMPAASYLSRQIAGLSFNWILIPIGMLMGWFIVQAEPAVHVLNKQVEEITSGAIPGKAMSTSLSIGVAVSIGLAMMRVMTGISIFWLVVPGYLAAIVMSFFVPKIFTAIAFDSGGVASGPMTATFLLPFAQGACEALGGNVVTDAFADHPEGGPFVSAQDEESRSGDASRPGGRGDHRAVSSPSDIVKRGETAMQGVDLFITITDRSRAEQFAAWFRTHGISLVLTALGQGTATTEVLDFLGLEATEKAVLFCVSPRSPRLVRQAARDLWLDVPGQGVLMTVPVNSIGGSTAKEYLLHEQEGETAMEREIAHDLIVVIANQGSTDLVMDAAREAGATGGTVIHAKGTGTDLVRKFFGVSIASEQEMVFILARSEAKKPIMKAIMAKAGIQSAAQSLVFSLPVGDIAGLRELEQPET